MKVLRQWKTFARSQFFASVKNACGAWHCIRVKSRKNIWGTGASGSGMGDLMDNKGGAI